MKISKRFLKQSEVYKLVKDDFTNLDFSRDALEEMYLFESQGIGNCNVDDQYINYLKTGKKVNGFAVGKKWNNITVAMWMKTINPIQTEMIKLGRDLTRKELMYLPMYGWANLLIELRNDIFPNWWLNKVFGDFLKSKNLKDIKEITYA